MGKFLCSFCYDKPVSFLESGIAEHSRVLESGVKKVRDGRESVWECGGQQCSEVDGISSVITLVWVLFTLSVIKEDSTIAKQ